MNNNSPIYLRVDVTVHGSPVVDCTSLSLSQMDVAEPYITDLWMAASALELFVKRDDTIFGDYIVESCRTIYVKGSVGKHSP